MENVRVMKTPNENIIGNSEDVTSPFSIYTEDLSKHHKIYMSGSIESPQEEYSDLIYLLDKATIYDLVTIRLNNLGGDLHTGTILAHAIKSSNAVTHIEVDSTCASMGAILALSGKYLTMKPGSYLMFHNYTVSHSGKGAEHRTEVDEIDSQFQKVLEYFCYPFLTKKELQKIANDGDIYVRAWDSDLPKRLSRHFTGK